jgi:hypothetical protein
VALAVDKVRWYAWSHFNPHTRLIGEERPAEVAAIS